jgi:signal transduction histidine kinase
MIIGNLILLIGYVLGGKLGMMFALPPGYSIPVFPPAGLALAALLLWRERALPGIFLGSWIFNSQVIPPQPDFSWVPVAIASGSSLQAWICARILRQWLPNRLIYNDVRSLFIFTAVSLLCCITAAAIGNFTLWSSGIIPGEAVAGNFFTWWLGDCLGVQIFCLLILVVATDWPKFSFRSGVALGGMLAGLGVSTLIYCYEKEERLNDFRHELDTAVELHMKRIDSSIVSKVTRLRGLEAYLSGEHVDFAGFVRYCELSAHPNQAFLNLQWAPLVSLQDWPSLRPSYEAEIGRTILLRPPPGQPVDEKETLASPVCYVYPLAANTDVLGINDMAVPQRRELIQKSIKEGMGASSSFKMFQDPDGPGGILLIRPTHRPEGSCSGVAIGMLSLRLLFQSLPGPDEKLKWQIHDLKSGNLICSNHPGKNLKDSLSTSRDFTLAGNEIWRLTLMQAHSDFPGRHNHIMIILALIFAAGLVSSLLIITGHSSKIEEVVEVRTAELRLAVAQAESSQRDAEKANAARGDFLATMSHEIRTPLNGVLGLSRILEDDKSLNDEQRGLVSTLRGSGESLHALLNNILDLSKIDSGKFSLDLHCFDLVDLCRKVVSLHQVNAQDKGLSLECLSSLPVLVLKGDSLRIWQCIGNLVGNAIKFTDTGGIKLHLDAENRGGVWDIHISIEDSGPGIAPEKIEQIFRPFEQSDSSISRRHGGTGLGLSISAKLAELMGGRLEVNSRLGKGSVFSLALQLPEGDAASLLAQTGPQQDLDLQLRILVVEDNPVNQKVITRMLSRYASEMKIAGDGRQALELISAEKDSFDLILMEFAHAGDEWLRDHPGTPPPRLPRLHRRPHCRRL